MPTYSPFQRIAVLWSTGFGSGLIPWVIRLPGVGGATFGSFAAGLIALFAFWISPSPWIQIALLVIHLGGAALCVEEAEHILGPRKDPKGRIRIHDQNEIVIDEWIAMFLISSSLGLSTWLFSPSTTLISFSLWLLLGFILFRIIDITKPWPLSRLEKFEGWIGVVADDALGGLITVILLLIVKAITSLLT